LVLESLDFSDCLECFQTLSRYLRADAVSSNDTDVVGFHFTRVLGQINRWSGWVVGVPLGCFEGRLKLTLDVRITVIVRYHINVISVPQSQPQQRLPEVLSDLHKQREIHGDGSG